MRAVFFVAGLGLVAVGIWSVTPANHWTELDALATLWQPAELAHDEALVEQGWRSHRAFGAHVDEVLNALEGREITLFEAAARVHEYAAACHTIYLENVDLTSPGRTLREKVARNLIKHFELEMYSGNPRGITEHFLYALERECHHTYVQAEELH